MSDSYFRRVASTTPSRLWINNPTGAEIGLALAQGAAGCTTNPTYGANLLRREPAYAREVIDSVVAATPGADDAAIATLVQRQFVARIAERFLPLHGAPDGEAGFVSIQGSPLVDDDVELILRGARADRKVAPNATPKVPATGPGLLALEALVEDGSPCIVTEVFSVSQLIQANERYLRVTARTGVTPPFFLSPITGIFGDHLRKVAGRDGIEADPRAMELAGVALGRRCYKVVMERSYPVTLLFGGGRIVDDFTGLVGGRTAATINYSTVEEILALDPAVEATIDQALPDGLLTELLGKFADFRRAWEDDALAVDEFEDFGPVQHFRDSFVSGWNSLLAAVAQVTAHARVTDANL
jgi:transaldolase